MQITQGDIYWLRKSKINKTYPYITNNEECDVLIIGGGLTGAITAYFLAKEGVNVIVAEKNIVGFGCTSGIPATLEYEVGIDLHRLEKVIGTISARKIYALCLDALSKIESINNEFDANTGFKRQDSLYFTNKFMQKQSMSKEFNSRKDAGFNPYFLQNHELINLNTGILTKNSSGVMNPYLFTQELFNYLSTLNNVKILENTEIVDIQTGYESVECKTNNNFNISAYKVIFASGYDSLKYMPNIPINLSKNFVIVTTPVENLNKFDINFTAREASDPYHYIRFTNNNRIIYSGEDVKFNDRLMDEKYLNNFASERYKRLYANMRKTFPNISNMKIDYTFNTTLVNTKDTLPIIDEVPNMPNCFFNLGFGNNGILYSAIGANMLKDAIKGYYTKDMVMFRADR